MDITKLVKQLDSRTALKDHALLRRMRSEGLSKNQVAVVLGQWFHPLHYFPNFVSRFIGLCSSMELKALMSKIVWQELGEGDMTRSHEFLFIQTMTDVGFDVEQITRAEAFPATAKLVAEYKDKSGTDYLATLGYVYATEAADLLMVSSIGSAVRKAVGVKELPWVDIHVKQEPDHTNSVDAAIAVVNRLPRDQLSETELKAVLGAADVMFGLWCSFFDEIESSMDRTPIELTA